MDRLPSSVAAVPVVDLPDSQVVLAWLPGGQSPAAAQFISAAASAAAVCPDEDSVDVATFDVS